MKSFWDQVKKGSGCWFWIGETRKEYGVFYFCGVRIPAHRASYELTNGPIDGGLLVCHKCDNKGCVRPGHLFLGTSKDNSRDMMAKGRGKNQFKAGSEHPAARLSASAIVKIKKLSESGITQSKIAKKFKIHQSAVSRVLNGKRWNCLNISGG